MHKLLMNWFCLLSVNEQLQMIAHLFERIIAIYQQQYFVNFYTFQSN